MSPGKRKRQDTQSGAGSGVRKLLLTIAGLGIGVGLAVLGSLLLLGPQESASSTGRNVAGDLPAELFADPDVQRAEQLLHEGRIDAAIEHLWAAHRRRADAPEPLVELTRIYLGRREPERALDAARQAVKLGAAGTAAHLVLGECLERAGDTDGAEEVYIEATKLAPEKPQAFYRLGRIAAEKSQSEVALAWYRKAVEADPGFAPAAHHLAIQYRKAGRCDEAVRLLHAALEADPGNSSLRCNLAHTYLKAGDPESAAREFRAAIPTALERAESYYFLGRALEMQQKDDEAREALHAALRWDRHLHMAWYTLAQLEKRLGRGEDSERAFREFERTRALRSRLTDLRDHLTKHPRDVAGLVEYARALIHAGNPEEAVASLGRASKLDPDNAVLPQLLEKAYEERRKQVEMRRRLAAELDEKTAPP